MKPDGVSQFDWERYLYRDEIMTAIRERSEWTHTRIRRRFHLSMALCAGSFVGPALSLILAVDAGTGVALHAPWLLLLVASLTLTLRNSPTRWYRRWNADHPQMGQYLEPDLTD